MAKSRSPLCLAAKWSPRSFQVPELWGQVGVDSISVIPDGTFGVLNICGSIEQRGRIGYVSTVSNPAPIGGRRTWRVEAGLVLV